MNASIQKHLANGKRRIAQRLDKTKFDGVSPVLSASNIHYETSEKTRAISAGGIGVIQTMVGQLGLDRAINRAVPILKVYLPYSESDHVLNIAYNIVAGGTCLDHLELRRNDEVYLDALGALRIPDPTTAGDFCRRFDEESILRLMKTINQTRLKVWQQQPDEFFDLAVIDADGTMVETAGQCKQGIDINYKGQWGYHPLIISLANTCEPLYLVNRRGNRPSHEGAAEYLDLAAALCRRSGFRRIRLRADTDFTQTKQLDRWDDEGVEFVFGINATETLYELAENLPPEAWKTLDRPEREIKTTRRRRPENVKQQIVEAREFTDIRLAAEHVAEFEYQPVACRRPYRVVVVWKDLEVHKGQGKLFDDARCFFYITNDRTMTAREIVFDANDRCDQENLIQQQKGGVNALTAPLGDLESNWAYMVMASLAWSLKAWSALLLPETPRWRERHAEEKRRLLRMDFATYRNALINIPAQIVRTGRKIVYRLLAWNPWQGVLFRLFGALKTTDYG
ncbi:IS1380 family transposase [Pirellulales bacterium]|nr:IS1380 family transposase [Pirellulales bacterium]